MYLNNLGNVYFYLNVDYNKIPSAKFLNLKKLWKYFQYFQSSIIDKVMVDMTCLRRSVIIMKHYIFFFVINAFHSILYGIFIYFNQYILIYSSFMNLFQNFFHS